MEDRTREPLAPAVFISHGSPMVVLERGPYQDALAAYGREVRPAAIVGVSAHWGTSTNISVSTAERYEAVYDFGGFPRELYQLTYSPPGDPALARRVAELLKIGGWSAGLVNNPGLDHGLWGPLRLIYSEATIPVVEISLPLSLTSQQLYDVGKSLQPLRAENVLVLGSGGIVHNLRMFRGGPIEQPVEAWAKEFDDWFQQKLEQRDVPSLIRYRELAPHADLAVPTFEHFAPVFVVLGAAPDPTTVRTIFEGFEYGALSMRSFAIA